MKSFWPETKRGSRKPFPRVGKSTPKYFHHEKF